MAAPDGASEGTAAVDPETSAALSLAGRGESVEEVARHYREGTLREAFPGFFERPGSATEPPAATPHEASLRAFRDLVRPPTGEPMPRARANLIDVDVHGDGVFLSLFVRFTHP